MCNHELKCRQARTVRRHGTTSKALLRGLGQRSHALSVRQARKVLMAPFLHLPW